MLESTAIHASNGHGLLAHRSNTGSGRRERPNSRVHDNVAVREGNLGTCAGPGAVRLSFPEGDPAKERANRGFVQGAAVAEPRATLLVSQIQFVIPRISARVPWRSDCLARALAAQNWLKSKEIASSVRIGTQRSPDRGFNAHAWSCVRDIAVMRGEFEEFSDLFPN